jgi:hypothetical protein
MPHLDIFQIISQNRLTPLGYKPSRLDLKGNLIKKGSKVKVVNVEGLVLIVDVA